MLNVKGVAVKGFIKNHQMKNPVSVLKLSRDTITMTRDSPYFPPLNSTKYHQRFHFVAEVILRVFDLNLVRAGREQKLN